MQIEFFALGEEARDAVGHERFAVGLRLDVGLGDFDELARRLLEDDMILVALAPECR